VATAVISQEEVLHWLALRLVPGLGTVGAIKLPEKLKSPQAIFRAPASELEGAGMSPAQAQHRLGLLVRRRRRSTAKTTQLRRAPDFLSRSALVDQFVAYRPENARL
jgi:hypothetical protein